MNLWSLIHLCHPFGCLEFCCRSIRAILRFGGKGLGRNLDVYIIWDAKEILHGYDGMN